MTLAMPSGALRTVPRASRIARITADLTFCGWRYTVYARSGWCSHPMTLERLEGMLAMATYLEQEARAQEDQRWLD